jgi:NAD(P)H-dependent flavin oxidoreductase YrpB (nitropropane dioxygenase family)
MKTPLCNQLGITYPIFSVGMAISAGPELAAAVSNAGGCGVLGAGLVPGPHMRTRIREVRRLTDRPFGVNLVLDVLQEGQIDVCFDEKIPILVLFWGDPAPYVKDAHRCGIKVFIQVGSVEEAIAAAATGVDAIIAQGIESGGHVKSTTPLSTILPAVVEAVKPLPVIASGGIANGRGIAGIKPRSLSE